MSMRRPGVLALCVIALPSFAALAGPLDPPVGPITPTLKPLSEIEPRLAINSYYTPGDFDSKYKITQPGSYYLTGDIHGVAGKYAIEVALVSPGAVTIDLNGYSVRGDDKSLSGIVDSTGFVVLHVRNGTVTGWPGIGVDGVQTLDRVVVAGNGAMGIYAQAAALVTNCIISGNGANNGYGIDAGPGSIITDCVVQFNGGSGGGGGIASGDNSQVRRCTVTSNAAALVSAMGFGIYVGYDCDIAECRVDNNGSSQSTSSAGINAGEGTSVTACRLYGNFGGGIRSGGEGIIAGNAVGSTTGIGIIVAGNRARVEGNHLFSNTSGGVRIEGTGCTVVRNSVKGSSAYSIPGGNDAGPIGTAATATSPWSNIAN